MTFYSFTAQYANPNPNLQDWPSMSSVWHAPYLLDQYCGKRQADLREKTKKFQFILMPSAQKMASQQHSTRNGSQL